MLKKLLLNNFCVMINKIKKHIPVSIKLMFRDFGIYNKYAKQSGKLTKYESAVSKINEVEPLKLEIQLKKIPLIGIVVDESDLNKDYVNPKSSWLRYERFCINNNIPYTLYNINKSDWLNESRKFDIIVCHTSSNPDFQAMIESKLYILEKVENKFCFPSFHEVWQYEDKIRSTYLYESHKLPMIPTIITHCKFEAYKLIEEVKYPFISKTTIGSGSSGVTKVESKNQAKKIIDKIFSYKGLKTQYYYQRQKNYFFIQEFIDDADFDLRIMLIGDKAFGYYRFPDKGDFRASGAGNVVKKEIPLDVLKEAIHIRNQLQSRQMGVDLLYSKKLNKYMIIETSLFNAVDTPRQLEIDGVAGYYDILDLNNIFFKEGEFWIQELLLRDLIEEWNEL